MLEVLVRLRSGAVAHGLQPHWIMHGVVGIAEGGYLRRALARLTSLAINRLSVLARRLGSPALTVPVSAAMLTRLPCIKPEQHLEDIAQLLVGGKVGELAVVEDGKPVAVVTRDDVALGIEQAGPHGLVCEAPRHDVVTVTPSDSLADVLEQLRAAPERVAVVVDHGEPVGLLTVDRIETYLNAAA
jgi:CBS domain-containing protein